MVAAQVIGNDATITLAGQSGNFQLNVMLPLVAYNLLQSIELLANVSDCWRTRPSPDSRSTRRASVTRWIAIRSSSRR